MSYWKQTSIASDNRFTASGRDTSIYTFTAPAPGGVVTVRAELRFGRLFQQEQEARGWDMPDVVVEEAKVMAPVEPTWRTYLPLVAQLCPRCLTALAARGILSTAP